MSRRVSLLCLLVLVPLVRAEEWPGWRGPRGDGTSRETGVPHRWSATDNIAWKVAIPGAGHSSPVVWGDRVFLTTALAHPGKGKARLGDRVVLCLDRVSGKELWRRTVLTAALEQKHSLNSFASGTPATDGKHLYFAFLDAPHVRAYCYDLDGNKVWEVSPGKHTSVHGFCTSPVLHKDLVILNCDQDAKGADRAYIVALDRRDGKERWRIDRPNRIRSYCTPVLVAHPKQAGVTQLVLSGSKSVTGYDADDGKLLWIHADGPTEQYVASLVEHRGVLFLTTGFPERHLMGITADAEGRINGTRSVLWHHDHRDNGDRGASYVPSPLAHDGHFFVVSDSGFLRCLEAKTGKPLYMHKLGRRHSASPVLVEGKLVIPDDDGVTWVVEARPKYELVRRNALGEPVFASPAVSRGQLFLRGEKHLYCIGR